MIPIFIQFRLPRIAVKIFRNFSALCTENDRKWLFVGKNKLAASISIHFSVKIVFSLIISGLESIINFFSDVNLQNIRSSIPGMLKWKWWNISLAELTCPHMHTGQYMPALKNVNFDVCCIYFSPKITYFGELL